MICRRHIRASKGQIFPWLMDLWQIDIFLLWSSFEVKFERVINELEVKYPLRCQSKYGLVGSSAKMGIFLSTESHEQKMCFFWV